MYVCGVSSNNSRFMKDILKGYLEDFFPLDLFFLLVFGKQYPENTVLWPFFVSFDFLKNL